jgi:Eukaryotic protein of unknown function (DUF829)
MAFAHPLTVAALPSYVPPPTRLRPLRNATPVTAETTTYTVHTNFRTDVLITVHVDLPTAPPRPTVLLLGWFGSPTRHIGKCAAVYRRLGYNTVQTTAPTRVVFSLTHPNSRQFLLSLLRILHANQSALLAGGHVVAPFSNGGAVMLPPLSEFLALPISQTPGALSPTLPALARSGVRLSAADAAAAVRAVLAGIMLDSFYMLVMVGAGALVEGIGLGRRPEAATDVRVVYAGMFVNLMVLGDPATRFWRALEGGRYGGVPELYLYRAADRLLDGGKVECLLKGEGKVGGGAVRTWRVVSGDPHPRFYIA